LIGYVLGWHQMRYNPLIRPITQLIVQRRFRRCGVATALIHAYGDRALADGKQILQAWTRADLQHAHAMWRSLGWTAIAVRTPETARGKPAMLWRKCLTAIRPPTFFDVPKRGGWNAASINAVDVATWRRSHA